MMIDVKNKKELTKLAESLMVAYNTEEWDKAVEAVIDKIAKLDNSFDCKFGEISEWYDTRSAIITGEEIGEIIIDLGKDKETNVSICDKFNNEMYAWALDNEKATRYDKVGNKIYSHIDEKKEESPEYPSMSNDEYQELLNTGQLGK